MRFPKTNPFLFAVVAIFLLLTIRRPVDTREKNSDKLIESTVSKMTGSYQDSQFLVYKKVRDSIERLITWQSYSADLPLPTPIGVTKMYRGGGDSDVAVQSFFKLKGVAVRSSSNIVLDRNDYYLEGSGADRKKINAVVSYLNPGDNGLTLLVPISNSSYKLLKTIFDILFWTLLVALVVIITFIPIRVFKNVAEGKSFLPENGKWLSILGWTILAVCVLSVLVPYLVRLIFLSNVPGEIYFPFWNALYDVKWGLLGGLAVLMTAKAFKDGYKIQKLQDLTI